MCIFIIHVTRQSSAGTGNRYYTSGLKIIKKCYLDGDLLWWPPERKEHFSSDLPHILLFFPLLLVDEAPKARGKMNGRNGKRQVNIPFSPNTAASPMCRITW